MAVYATMLVLSILVIAMAYVGERRDQRKAALDRLGTVTSTLAAQLNPGHVVQILDKYDGRGMVIKNTQDAWYYVMHDHLQKACERNGLTQPVRVLSYDSVKQELQVVVTSAVQPEYRSPYQGNVELVMAKYHAGDRLDHDQGVDPHLIAFDVLSDHQNGVVAIVMSSMEATEPDAIARAALWRNLLIALVLFSVAGMVLFSSVGRWLKRDEAEHDDLLQRHTGMEDSIAYAGKIQRALVPSPAAYAEFFDASFVIDRPKDVVSGDFHWIHRVDDDIQLVAAADCTGHGLPGAMMAAIGCSLLNEVVTQYADKDPAELLGILNSRMVTTLHQQGKRRGGGDGMDIALCRVDKKHNEILFAGAMRPLYWLHHDRITVINGDRKPVGGAHQELDRRYTVHRLAYTPGDRIYLFSDGYVDQFGGPERKRFMNSRLLSLLNEHRNAPLEQQATFIENAFLEWKGEEEQVDDVCMLGIAI